MIESVAEADVPLKLVSAGHAGAVALQTAEVPAGLTDSKLLDFQVDHETGYTEPMSALAGANLIYEAADMYGSPLACSLESFVLGNDLIGAFSRARREIARAKSWPGHCPPAVRQRPTRRSAPNSRSACGRPVKRPLPWPTPIC